MKELEIQRLYDLSKTMCGTYLEGFTYPWEALKGIGEEILRLGALLSPERFEKRGEGIWIARSAKVAKTASVTGPCIIGERTEVRHGAFLRGKVIAGEGCVIGNSTELKNAILFDQVQVPHFNYIGDSILGFRAHLGAGAVTSNIKSDRSEVKIISKKDGIPTGLIKVGAFLADEVEVGCNSVLNPGTVVGKKTNIYPLSMVRGVVPEKSIYKKQGEVVRKYE